MKALWKQGMMVMFVIPAFGRWRQHQEFKVILATPWVWGQPPETKNKTKQTNKTFECSERKVLWVICHVTSLHPHNSVRGPLLRGTSLFPRELQGLIPWSRHWLCDPPPAPPWLQVVLTQVLANMFNSRTSNCVSSPPYPWNRHLPVSHLRTRIPQWAISKDASWETPELWAPCRQSLSQLLPISVQGMAGESALWVIFSN